MGFFYGHVELRKTGSQSYITLSGVGYENKELVVMVERGLRTDGASIPKYLWSIVGSPMTGNYVLPAIIHDALYASGALSQKDADVLFLQMMKDNGVGWWKRHTIYRGVRMGGWASYMKHSDEQREEAQRLTSVELF